MRRLHRRWAGVGALGALVVLASAFVARPAGSVAMTVGDVAEQLGVKVGRQSADQFTLGVQFTGTLVHPAKLASLGIEGMQAGARVVAARIGEALVHVEADELEPPRRASTQLRLDANGKLSRPVKP